MLNYEDLMGNILSYVANEKISECDNEFLNLNGYGGEFIFYSCLKEDKNGEEKLHTIVLDVINGDVIYIDEEIVNNLNEPCYVNDLTLEMQEYIYTELNRSVMRMIRDLNKNE